MSFKLWVNFVSLLVTIGMMTSCARVEEPVSTEQRVNELLNAGRFDEAISVLEGVIRENPEDHAARLRLASAYAGSVKFNLIDTFEAFEPLIDYTPSTKKAPQVSVPESEIAAMPESEFRDGTIANMDIRLRIKKFERNLLISIYDAESLTQIMFRLPYLGISERVKIAKAIKILEPVPEGEKSFTVATVYRGVLHFVTFSNYFRDSMSSVANDNDTDGLPLKIYCGLNMSAFSTNIRPALSHLEGGLLSLNRAGSKSEGRMYRNVESGLRSLKGVQSSIDADPDFLHLADVVHRTFKDDLCH
jgi:hypothetical protein